LLPLRRIRQRKRCSCCYGENEELLFSSITGSYYAKQQPAEQRRSSNEEVVLQHKKYKNDHDINSSSIVQAQQCITPPTGTSVDDVLVSTSRVVLLLGTTH
jgi:hypothetical protein